MAGLKDDRIPYRRLTFLLTAWALSTPLWTIPGHCHSLGDPGPASADQLSSPKADVWFVSSLDKQGDVPSSNEGASELEDLVRRSGAQQEEEKEEEAVSRRDECKEHSHMEAESREVGHMDISNKDGEESAIKSSIIEQRSREPADSRDMEVIGSQQDAPVNNNIEQEDVLSRETKQENINNSRPKRESRADRLPREIEDYVENINTENENSTENLITENAAIRENLIIENGIKENAEAIPTLKLIETLRNILEYPLAGRDVFLVVDQRDEDAFNIDVLLSYVTTPLVVLVTSQDVEEDEELASMEVNGVLVILVNTNIPWPLNEPPETWSASAAVLLHRNFLCDSSDLLQTPLVDRTVGVAVVCPFQSVGDGRRSAGEFRVSTFRPYDAVQKHLTLGTWDVESFATFDRLFVDRYPDFGGEGLHAATDVQDAPFFFKTKEGTYEGIGPRIVAAIASVLNFTFSFTDNASDRQWGSLENGTWVGMLGDVYHGRKNFTINYLTITHQRVQYFDFSTPYYSEGFGFMARVPPPLPRHLSILLPFTGGTWAAVFVSALVVILIFYLLTRFKHHVYQPLGIVLGIVQSLFNQAPDKLPSSWSLKIFLLSWGITAYIIIISYTCNLTASLTSPKFVPRIKTIEQLAAHKLKVCMLDYGEFVPEELRTTSHETLSALGRKLELVPLTTVGYYGEEACVERVLKGTHAHLETYSYTQNMYHALGVSSEVYTIKDQIYKGYLAFFYPKGTAWKGKVDGYLARLVEAGLPNRWYEEIMPKPSVQDPGGQVILSLSHLQGAFFILFAGLSLALGAFVVEIFYKPTR